MYKMGRVRIRGSLGVLSSIHYLYSAFYNAKCMLLSKQKAADFLSYFNSIFKFQ